MEQKPLIETNPYLQDSSLYEKLLTINVSTSSAIELGALSSAITKSLKKKKQPQLIFPADGK